MEKNEFYELLKDVPKTELHLHIEAVPTINTIKTLYKKCNNKEISDQEISDLFTYDDLNGFIQSFIKIQNMYTTVEDFNLVFDDLESYLVENGIVYTEVFFAPTSFLKKGFKYDDMIQIFEKRIEQIKNDHNITIKMIMDVSRTFGLENAMNNYNLLKLYPCKDIIGIGLGGAESKGPAKEYQEVFETAYNEGYKVVTHAGEDVGPESIWDAVDLCKSMRIGHGTTAFQDEKLMQELKDRQIPIEICITSNTFTKAVVKEAKEHPVKSFFKKGIPVTINTDDPVFFKTNLLQELWICYDQINFTMPEIKQLILNSFTASFMTKSEKEFWCEKVESSFKND